MPSVTDEQKQQILRVRPQYRAEEAAKHPVPTTGKSVKVQRGRAF
jgi:hypothetical protein